MLTTTVIRIGQLVRLPYGLRRELARLLGLAVIASGPRAAEVSGFQRPLGVVFTAAR